MRCQFMHYMLSRSFIKVKEQLVWAYYAAVGLTLGFAVHAGAVALVNDTVVLVVVDVYHELKTRSKILHNNLSQQRESSHQFVN
jgi:hypothetical protein